jgi:MoaA/NifB/PqqE/SkfB family radical SAM enzyme
MKIIKAELLISRTCSRYCSGCAMKKIGVEYEKYSDTAAWSAGLSNLKKAGCEFIALYGAEPLDRDAAFLKNLIGLIKEIGMSYTIITGKYDVAKAKSLNLKSLSVSYDGRNASGKERIVKSHGALTFLKSFPEIADRACILTLSKQTINELISTVDYVLSLGYWFLFDLAHNSNNMPKNVSKCTQNLDKINATTIKHFLQYLIDLKKDGAKVHCSIEWLEYLQKNFNQDIRTIWHCKKSREVGWVTVNYDGTVYPCDDFQEGYVDKLWEIDDWSHFEMWRNLTVSRCPGCAWNTHFDGCLICETNNRGTYVH